ncbi:MAG: hypothetical protein EXS13_13380 [Planctomycetes bacterium]|nr:hypothetical protein [Planctomycetota bacterium]
MSNLLPDWLRSWLEEPIVNEWLCTLGWAAGVALLVQVAGALAGGTLAKSGAAGSVALVLGFVASVCTVVPGMPALPPAERWQWCAWLTAASLLLLLFEERQRATAMLRFLVHLGLVVALVWWIVRPSGRAREWSPLELQIAQIGGGLALLLLLLLGEARVATGAAWTQALPGVLAAAGAVAILGDCTFDRLARCAAGLFAAQLVALLIGVAHRATPPSRAAFSAGTIALSSVLAYAVCARSISDAAALLLLLAWACVLLPARTATTGRALLMAGGLPALLCGIAWFVRATPQ